MKKKMIVICLAVLALGLLIFLAGRNNPPDPAGTNTLSQGTQMHYGNIDVALGNINNDSAWMYFHNNKTGASTQKQVKAGDTVVVYSYSIKINSVKKTLNPSTAPGSSHGNVKFVIVKQ